MEILFMKIAAAQILDETGGTVGLYYTTTEAVDKIAIAGIEVDETHIVVMSAGVRIP